MQRMQEQMQHLCSMASEGVMTRLSAIPSGEGVKLTNLSGADNTEAYLTTFKCLMHTYDIDKMCWAVKIYYICVDLASSTYSGSGISGMFNPCETGYNGHVPGHRNCDI